MNVPIKMIGIATSIFWIILIGYFASAAYSLKDLNFNFGEPQFTTTAGNDLSFSLPLYVENGGFYNLNAFNLTTVFTDVDGDEFNIGEPTVRNLDPAHIGVSAPLSFENHAAYDVRGDLRLELCDSAGAVLAETQLPLNVPKQSEYADRIAFSVPFDATAPPPSLSGHFNVYFSTAMFEYGPLVIPYG
jgi:hypothetical protein